MCSQKLKFWTESSGGDYRKYKILWNHSVSIKSARGNFVVKVRTFWETHKIWKNLPHGFDKSADLLSKRQNHEEDIFKLCVLLRKSEL